MYRDNDETMWTPEEYRQRLPLNLSAQEYQSYLAEYQRGYEWVQQHSKDGLPQHYSKIDLRANIHGIHLYLSLPV